MIYEKSVGPDEVMRVIATMAEVGRSSVDWVALAKAVAEQRQERIEQERYRAAVKVWSAGPPDDEDLLKAPVADPEALMVEINSILLGSVVRMSQAWQRVLETHAPRIRERLEVYQSTEDPEPYDRTAVIVELSIMLNEVGRMARDQASLFEDDLYRLREKLLPL
jgi:hypothetical protein